MSAVVHNAKRAVGRYSNSGKGWLLSAVALVSAGVFGPNDLIYDVQPEVPEEISAQAMQSLDKQIERMGDLRQDFNQASNVYYSNLYGQDKTLANDARADMISLQKTIKQQSYGILVNTYLNPALNNSDYKKIHIKMDDLDLPTSIPLKNGKDYDVVALDSEHYKTCQVQVHHDFNATSSNQPLNQVMDVHKCMKQEDLDEAEARFGAAAGFLIPGMLFMWLLQHTTYNAGWSSYSRREKPNKPKH
tara:strand:+ start:1133 stop:1870 length:738 start_codon:yes stop_codon:yes gene_type:complete